FPYTTLFRSRVGVRMGEARHSVRVRIGGDPKRLFSQARGGTARHEGVVEPHREKARTRAWLGESGGAHMAAGFIVLCRPDSEGGTGHGAVAAVPSMKPM